MALAQIDPTVSTEVHLAVEDLVVVVADTAAEPAILVGDMMEVSARMIKVHLKATLVATMAMKPGLRKSPSTRMATTIRIRLHQDSSVLVQITPADLARGMEILKVRLEVTLNLVKAIRASIT